MSLLFLCKLISLNIWVVKFKRRLFYVFVLTLTRTLQTIAKKNQKLTRFLSGCLFFYTVSSGWFLFKGPKTSLTHANVLGFANIVTFTSQVAVPCELLPLINTDKTWNISKMCFLHVKVAKRDVAELVDSNVSKDRSIPRFEKSSWPILTKLHTNKQ